MKTLKYMFFAAVLLPLAVFSQNLEVTAGQALFYFNASDSQNVNSAYTFVGFDYGHTWSAGQGAFTLFTESGLLKDGATGGAGFGYDALLGGRGHKALSDRTDLVFKTSYGLSVNPEYDNGYDLRTLEVEAGGETTLERALFLNYGLSFTRLDYPNLPVLSGNAYELSGGLSRSFESGRSLKLRLDGGLKQYDNSSSSLRLATRLQAGQSLGARSGISVYAEGALGSNGAASGAAIPLSDNIVVDPYAFDEFGAGLKVKTVRTGARFAASYGFEQRTYRMESRTDLIHGAGLEWTLFLNQGAGKTGVNLSFEPSARLIQSTVEGEDYLAVYLSVGTAW